jgi:hypothetical protein
MGVLDGDVSALFNAAFSDMYLDATLHAGTGEPIYDAAGNITGYLGGDTPARCQVDAATDAMRRDDGFSEGDVRLIILAQGLPAINDNHQLTVKGVRYFLASPSLDAAASHWTARGRPRR